MDQVGEVAYLLQGFQLGGLELDVEAGFYGYDQVDVVEGVPLLYVRRSEAGRQDEGVVIEDVAEDFGELSVDFLLLHVL